MDMRELQLHWNTFGLEDPMWAILTKENKKGGKWDVEAFFETGKVEISRLFNLLEKLNVTLPPGKAMDFGCGIGRLTQAMAEHMDEVVGIDIAPSMIEKANILNHHIDKVTYYLNEQNALSNFPSESFSFIYSNITLQHMRPRYAKVYIQEFVRLLKKDGVMVFQMPAKRKDLSLRGLIYRLASAIDHDRGAAFLHYIIKKSRTDKSGALMEMYGSSPRHIKSWLKGMPVELLLIRENRSAGKQWQSFRYVIRKK